MKVTFPDPPGSKAAPILEVIKLDPRARLPERYNDQAIGLDVFAFLLTESGRATSRALHIKGVTEVPTGIKVHPPSGYFVQVSSRLTLARKAIFVANAPAMLPEGFDSELTILLFNGSFETQYVAHEHRIAHLTLHRIIPTEIKLHSSEHQEDVRPRPGKGDS